MAEETETKPTEEEVAVKPTTIPAAENEKIASPVKKSGSFREESNLVTDLQEYQKKALDELKSLLRSALDANQLSPPKSPLKLEALATLPPAPAAAAEDEKLTPPDEISIWGVPLLEDSKSDTVLLKFLRAREFKAKEAMAMIRDTILWRREFGIDELVKEDLKVPELDKAVFMGGVDKERHPVCYNVYGEFQDKEVYEKAFGDAEKRKRFLRWRIQYLERGIREFLDFSPGSVSTMVQVTDLKNSPGLLKAELRQALYLLQDNYPEFVAKQIFINVPWWYLAFNKMIGPFLTQRTKSKFVFAGPSKSAETLFNYIAPEEVPVQFGGLSKEKDVDFTTLDAVNEINVKPSAKQIIEIPVAEKCLLVWELRVIGWEVALGAEFVPSSEDGYTVIIEKKKKLAPSDELVVKNSFKISEPGKVVLTVDNTSSKKKKVLYRYKASCSS